MSLTGLMPRRRPKSAPKHRVDDKVERMEILLAGARALIKGMHLQLVDQAAEHEETVRRIDERHAEVVTGLEAELADARHRLGIACQASAAADQTQEIDTETVRRIFAQPVPLHQAPFATTDPGHVRVRPSWARDT
ncbi:hypothetical protein ACWD25_53210 [Streptomyces sp. NPDC002920]